MDRSNKNLQLIIRTANRITDKIGTQNLAIGLMLLENILWPIGFIYVSHNNFSPIQTSLVRGISICITHILLCSFLGISLDVRQACDLKHLTIRNLLIIIHQIIYTSMYFVISFPLNNSILLTSPLFVFVIDYYINGVRIYKSQILGIGLGFLGIFLNINGDYLMGIIDSNYETHSTFENYYVTDIRLKIVLSVIAFLSNGIWAYAIVSQKKISHIPGIKISLYLGLQFLLISAVIFCCGIVEPISVSDFFYGCIFSGLCMSFCQIIFISALNLSKNTGKLSILQLFCGVSSYAISFYKYQEEINWICVVGIVVMAYGLYRSVFIAEKEK